MIKVILLEQQAKSEITTHQNLFGKLLANTLANNSEMVKVFGFLNWEISPSLE
jgi:hypothetical protein